MIVIIGPTIGPSSTHATNDVSMLDTCRADVGNPGVVGLLKQLIGGATYAGCWSGLGYTTPPPVPQHRDIIVKTSRTDCLSFEIKPYQANKRILEPPHHGSFAFQLWSLLSSTSTLLRCVQLWKPRRLGLLWQRLIRELDISVSSTSARKDSLGN